MFPTIPTTTEALTLAVQIAVDATFAPANIEQALNFWQSLLDI
ncbi:MAG TPA: hypothetical protein VFU22_14750 [Roseiflexaceae bacterium]|nr:hypothetical protein [Roseiflexaceae bacterium]